MHFSIKILSVYTYLEQRFVAGLFALAEFVHYPVGDFIGREFDVVEEGALVFVAADGHHLHRVEQPSQV